MDPRNIGKKLLLFQRQKEREIERERLRESSTAPSELAQTFTAANIGQTTFSLPYCVFGSQIK